MEKITIPQGNDRAYEITVKNADGTDTNITGWTILFTVKNDLCEPDVDALIAATATISSPTTSPQAYINLSASNTDIALGLYKYDLKFKDGSGKVQNTDVGVFEVTNRVTIRSS